MCRPGPNPNRKKLVALWVVGILTTIYVVAELVLAIWTKSLVLLSDGFHNLSDVVSIIIAYWSIVKSASGASDTMSFGWKRTEIVGALINACSLLSLCLYILLEAIPRFVHPEEILVNKYFLGIAGTGIGVNLIGTIIFYFTGTHAHAHAHDEAEEIIVEEEEESHAHAHGHDHGSEKKHTSQKKSNGPQSPSPHHSINDDGNGEDSYVVLDENGIEVRQPKKKKKKEHSHDHDDHHHNHEPGHDHHHHDHEHEHDHTHDEKSPIQAHEHKKGVGKKKKHHDHHHDHDHHGHGHSHDHSHSHGGHGHSHDMNMWAVFVHYLGDAISSVFVLVTGILVYLFPEKKWSLYLDPISSLIIVGIMLYSTIPLVRQCALILLQRVPPHVNLGILRKKLLKIENVLGAHDLHVWCLVDGMTICTVHLAIDAPEHFISVTKTARKLFHQFGIHSSTIQPEYPLADLSHEYNTTELQTLATRSTQLTNCEQNCLPNCKEDWCCKNTPNTNRRTTHGALDFDPVFNPREPDPPRLNPPPGDHIV